MIHKLLFKILNCVGWHDFILLDQLNTTWNLSMHTDDLFLLPWGFLEHIFIFLRQAVDPQVFILFFQASNKFQTKVLLSLRLLPYGLGNQVPGRGQWHGDFLRILLCAHDKLFYGFLEVRARSIKLFLEWSSSAIHGVAGGQGWGFLSKFQLRFPLGNRSRFFWCLKHHVLARLV